MSFLNVTRDKSEFRQQIDLLLLINNQQLVEIIFTLTTKKQTNILLST